MTFVVGAHRKCAPTSFSRILAASGPMGYDKDIATVICVFGEPDAPATIGAHTLEAFLLGVGPVGRRLIPVEGYWA